MTWLRFNGGPADSVILDIAPTMKNLTHMGERYFRMPDTRAINPDIEQDEPGHYGGAYLWTRYWDKDQIELRRGERERYEHQNAD